MGVVRREIRRMRGILDGPDALHVILPSLHIYVYRPDIPSFGMGDDDALEQRLSSLRFAQFVF
jgi:hypothetical protein